MSKKVGDGHWEKGYRRTIMRILLTCGVISKKGMRIMDGNYLMYMRKIGDMKEENLIDEVSIGNRKRGVHKTVRLKDYENNHGKYIGHYPGYMGHYERYAMRNAIGIGKTTRANESIKAYRESEVVMLLTGTPVKVYPDEKIAVRRNDSIPLYPPSFYNSLEVKEASGYEYQTRGQSEREKNNIASRIIGMIISEGGIYAVYHTEKQKIRWAKSSEAQMANSITHFINERCTIICEEEKEWLKKEGRTVQKRKEEYKDKEKPFVYSGKIDSAMLVGSDIDIFIKTFQNEENNKIKVAENGYRKLYMIPYDKNGQNMVTLMTEKGWEEKIKDVYLTGNVNRNTRTFSVECDAIDEEGNYILVFCIPDLVKLKKYLRAVEWNEEQKKQFVIYCFDWQLQFLQEVTKNEIEIQVASFEEYCNFAIDKREGE